jgi:hypothetical protein
MQAGLGIASKEKTKLLTPMARWIEGRRYPKAPPAFTPARDQN